MTTFWPMLQPFPITAPVMMCEKCQILVPAPIEQSESITEVSCAKKSAMAGGSLSCFAGCFVWMNCLLRSKDVDCAAFVSFLNQIFSDGPLGLIPFFEKLFAVIFPEDDAASDHSAKEQPDQHDQNPVWLCPFERNNRRFDHRKDGSLLLDLNLGLFELFGQFLVDPEGDGVL